MGTKLWFNYNNKMGTIIEYNHETCTVTIDSNVFQYFFENIDYEDYKDKNLSEFYREAYIVNMSFHKGNNIVLLGNTLDLNSEYIVENVTNRWRSKLKQFESNYFIEDLGSLSYSLLDTYIVYRDEPKQSRLYSIKFANSASNTIDVTDSILYLTTTDYIVLIVDKYTHEKRYYKIENINGNQITISNTNALSMKNHVIALLPIENNFSTLTIDKNEYEKKVLLDPCSRGITGWGSYKRENALKNQVCFCITKHYYKHLTKTDKQSLEFCIYIYISVNAH
mgnify:CR=1 FL=1